MQQHHTITLSYILSGYKSLPCFSLFIASIKPSYSPITSMFSKEHMLSDIFNFVYSEALNMISDLFGI